MNKNSGSAIYKVNDRKGSFYTFQSYEALKAFYGYLGPSADSLTYSKVESENQQGKICDVDPALCP